MSNEDAPPPPQNLEEQVEIVTFEDDSAVLPEHVPGEIALPMFDTMQHTDERTHSVVSFLRRPQLVSSFTWSPSASRNESILPTRNKSLMIPTDTFTSMVRNKLDGFTSFRATCVLKLQVNAQPFQCGRLLLVAIPMPTLLGGRKDFIFKHVTLCQAVNHVQMDIAKQTEVELRIPFVSPYNSFDLIEGIFDWAEVKVLIYSKYNAVEQTTEGLQCLLWAHYEDIVLGAPTSSRMTDVGPQRIRSKLYGIRDIEGDHTVILDSDRYAYAVEQAGRVVNAKGSPKEVGPAQVKQARAREAVTKDSPLAASVKSFGSRLIGTGTTVVNGITSAVGAIANLFGWSKPVPDAPGCAVLNRPVENFSNADGNDHSHVLALSVRNNIENYPGLVGSNMDEMSFDFIKRIPQYIDNFRYTDATKYGTMLWQSAVSPMYVVPATFQLNAGSEGVQNSWYQPTCLNYAMGPFAYWTGSLVYTFRFVKTDFHSGRIEVSYHPFTDKVDATRMEYVYRTVVDLRENSEVSVTIPYVAPQPWKKVAYNIDPLKQVALSSATGMIYVRALTPLICANTIISKDVEVLVEVRAGSDFQVQAPTASPYIPYAVQQSGRVSDVDQTGPVVYAAVAGSVRLKSLVDSYSMPLTIPSSVPRNKFLSVRINARVSTKTEGALWKFSPEGTDWQTFPIISNQLPLDICTQVFVHDGLPEYAVNWFGYSDFAEGDQLLCNFYFVKEDPQIVRVDGSEGVLQVKVDETTLPLWTTPFGPEEEQAEVAKQQSGVVAVPGTQETRTRAIEGYVPPSITGNPGDVDRLDTSQYCAGELFRNFRQLTRRFGFTLVNQIPSSSVFSGLAVSLVRPPTIYTGRQYDKPASGAQEKLLGFTFVLGDSYNKSEMCPSPLSYIGAMYAFYRGGVRIKTFLEPSRNPSNLVSISYSYLDNAEISNPDIMQNVFEPTAFELPQVKQLGEFQLPYYSPTLITVHWNHNPVDQYDQPQLKYKVGSSSVSPVPLRLAAAASDDLDFELFIGAPPVFRVADLIQDKPTLGAWRILHAPDQYYSPTQTYNKATQSKFGRFALDFGKVSSSMITVVDTINSVATAVRTSESVVRAKRDLARQALNEDIKAKQGQQLPRSLIRQGARQLLSVPDHESDDSVELSSSDEGIDEIDPDVDFDEVRRRQMDNGWF